MRRLHAAAIPIALFALIVTTAAGAAQAINPSSFRYERALSGASGRPLLVTLDEPLLGHARADLSDIRVLDANGAQVPWRTVPEVAAPRPQSIPLIDVGRENGVLVALLDLGAGRRIVNRIDLQIPGSNFVSKVEVRGSDDRLSFRSLGKTLVYDVRGATHSRSTAISFRSSDLRYLELRASGLPGISGATVSRQGVKRLYRAWKPGSTTRKEREATTVVTLDLGYRLPVTLLDVLAATSVYDRPLEVLGSNDGSSWLPLADGRVFRFEGAAQDPIAIDAQARYLRLRIENGDDKPLGAITVRVLAHTRTLYVKGGAPGPYRMLYGSRSRSLRATDYDLARVPRAALGLDRAVQGRLGEERAISPATVSEPAKSLLDRYPWLIEAALALVAIAFGAAGFIVFRSKT
ncbi:MAG: DUF3999 family protein [Gaiellaceae bacterium]